MTLALKHQSLGRVTVRRSVCDSTPPGILSLSGGVIAVSIQYCHRWVYTGVRTG